MAEQIKIVLFGCGGRIIWLFNNVLPKILLERNVDLKIVAIIDDNIHKVIQDCNASQFKDMLKDTVLYDDETKEEDIYQKHEFDLSVICSRNDKHYKSLILANKYNKNIFCEKPIVHRLDQVNSILKEFKDRDTKNLFFQTGLVLRYSTICTTAKQYLPLIGDLQKVNGCELLDIGHGGQIIMKNWRRYKSISGGLGIEKCVHDYDMILHFIDSVFKIPLNNIDVLSTAKNDFWIPERKEEIMAKINSDKALNHSYYKWDNRLFQRETDDSFTPHPDLIPDQQHVTFKIKNGESVIPVEFDISTGSFRTKTERWYEFIGTNGSVKIDMVNLAITINVKDRVDTINLVNLMDGHAGGDYYLLNTMVDLLTKTNKNEVVTFEEAMRSTIIGCLSEQSVNTCLQVNPSGNTDKYLTYSNEQKC
jgi:predicted dehydrogenase